MTRVDKQSEERCGNDTWQWTGGLAYLDCASCSMCASWNSAGSETFLELILLPKNVRAFAASAYSSRILEHKKSIYCRMNSRDILQEFAEHTRGWEGPYVPWNHGA